MGCDCSKPYPCYLNRLELHNLCLEKSKVYHKYNSIIYKNMLKFDSEKENENCKAIGKNPYKTAHYYYTVIPLKKELESLYSDNNVKVFEYEVKTIVVSEDGYYIGPSCGYFVSKTSIPFELINDIYNLLHGKSFRIIIGYIKTNKNKSEGYIVNINYKDIVIKD